MIAPRPSVLTGNPNDLIGFLMQEKQSSDSASIQVLRLPETSAANQTSSGSNGKARSQTVNGKPLALDVSSLIGKPSASSSSSVATNPDEVPLNLSMKTKEDAANAAANVAASTVMADSLAPCSLLLSFLCGRLESPKMHVDDQRLLPLFFVAQSFTRSATKANSAYEQSNSAIFLHLSSAVQPLATCGSVHALKALCNQLVGDNFSVVHSQL